MSTRKRMILEATWSRNGQVCQREVIRWGADTLSRVTGVRFTDGTALYVRVRPAGFREKIAEVHGYDDVFRSIVQYKITGFPSVERIPCGYSDHRAAQSCGHGCPSGLSKQGVHLRWRETDSCYCSAVRYWTPEPSPAQGEGGAR